MSKDDQHITSYKTISLVLLGLLFFTFLTVAITRVELGPYNTSAAMIIAGLKAALVLVYFMHLKFDQKVFGIMVIFVLLVFLAVIVVTFFDYLYR
ncbi:MAG: cytochrome C oxidase subunit IV family protein [Bacteroidales bacterium]|nr:cytochrome C oxidase subunit IV family protein [Bacteroidales bacterium]